jgi:hypothetical protein
MARDPRKGSAFESGMRGREKPKIADAHGKTVGSEAGSNSGGESKQGANSLVGTPDGVDLSAYTSGMRGPEQPKQKPASGAANDHPSGGGGENKQGPNTVVGEPGGHNDAGQGAKKGVNDSHLQSVAKGAHEMGIPGSSTEQAAIGQPEGTPGILGEEDETHINVRIPKASLRKKASGVHAG